MDITVNGELVPATAGNAVPVSPELAAAMAETRLIRERIAKVADRIPSRGFLGPAECENLRRNLRSIAGLPS